MTNSKFFSFLEQILNLLSKALIHTLAGYFAALLGKEIP
jgi:hypothetical protein